ncbi:hypothetical protein VOLCADRAFT_93587 [Volvox carteri f. nagariensis]|uniref:TFIIS central domain-containing protein n=1 Tax=Volvox carteri f. nagariensis TaxID=3068 RepID=D8U2I1_VOLCA|nr:uncharacterized protein VOLCADRAFT_93587 [Volvox carteri f. nagariensis]EFJ46065.1 hypothetical protein VOLCADRAFT_93587 [Volvox carteri f. nagariensis]|eukprot:XP_002952815.1 hypothetical protein VOLCADRAFT_93587 [Volvox carteri f. nagariensis]
MKRKDIWKELNLPPPPKKPSKTAASARPARQEAAQQELRSSCVRTLFSALSTPSPDGGQQQPSVDEADLGDAAVEPLAQAIERELFFRHHHQRQQQQQQSVTDQEYKAAARTLVASLKRNADLRRRVLSGQVRPDELVGMGVRQLATPQQQEEYARLQERETRRVTLAGHGSAASISTSDYVCGRCGGRSCDYLDSGRRDIGKCETWGSKDGPGSSRLVTCLGCGHRWETDDV